LRKNSIDTVIRVRLRHRPGQLARLAGALAAQGALIGDVTTVAIGEAQSVRELTIETSDEAQTARVLAAVRALEDVELLSTADRVFERHRGGKLRTASRVEVRELSDLRDIYTPGVARVARAIERDPALAWIYTSISSTVGIFTNGTRVLGLGDIGPLASLPVMEGKAILYDRFAGLSAVPLLLDTKDPDEFIETVVRLSRGFGGIHLEDIRIPDCFRIEKELDARLDKPVMHDDQHGTATVALAAIINACRLTGLDLKRSRLGQIGLGAAGSAIARLAISYGAGDVLVTDVSAEARARLAGEGARPVDFETLMREADIVVATTGRPGLIQPSMVRPGQVIFALSNPDPEIFPDDALAAGAAFAGDGRSINNALAFPGIFKGALAVQSRAITPAMLVAAAEAIASHAEPGEIVPSPLGAAVHQAVCDAVSAAARVAGLAGTSRVLVLKRRIDRPV
jgi:malate dehydrogenase (oxaloacetate-decarboxylating)